MTEIRESGTAEVPLPSALLTFLIADVRGYTRFTVEHGDAAAARLALRFAEQCEQVVEAHEGDVIELRGDEALCVFSSARIALRAAIALQRVFKEATQQDPSMPLNVGMGLDAGEPIPVKGGYRGGALNLAARLCSVAGPGEVFCSETLIGLARKTEGISFVDRGEVTLKGLSSPVRVIQIASEGELPDEAPPLQPILVTHPTNLPDEATPFIGREREINEIAGLLRHPQIRMVTLTGPGGTGKTRLSLQVGSTLLHDFRDGVFFVSLASITDPELVTATIATVLGVSEAADRPILETVVGRLEHKHLLLVLDNYEHLLDAVSIVASLLDACRDLHVLVASRIPLHLSREHEHSVPPLSVPDPTQVTTAETLSQYESVALFIERARAVKDSFAVTNDNAPAVAEICCRLDGLPLAIELAAARIKLFPPQALLQRLSNRFKLLTGGPRDRPSRQQTLRGAIDLSYSLLTGEEQTLLARLSVFAGGCTFVTAEAVCNPGGDLDLLEGMTSLVDKSMLRQEGEDEPRFGMLETIREYAREKLTERGEDQTIRDGHLVTFPDLAEEANREIHGPEQLAWCERLETERDNLRTALDWAGESGQVEEGLRVAGALSWFWYARGHWTEGRERLLLLLGLPMEESERKTVARANVLHGAGFLAKMQGDLDIAEHLMREAIALAVEVGPEGARTHACSCGYLAIIHASRAGDEAAGFAKESLRIAHQSADRWAEGIVHTVVAGYLAMLHDRLDEARRHYEEGLAIFRELGDTLHVAAALLNLGHLSRLLGDSARARGQLEEALGIDRAIGMKRDGALTLAMLSSLLLTHGEVENAIGRATEALEWCREIGDREIAAYAMTCLGDADIRRGDYDRARSWCEQALSLNRTLGIQSNVAEALSSLAFIALRQGDLDGARDQCEQGLDLARTVGADTVLASVLRVRGRIARAEGQLGQAGTQFREALQVVSRLGYVEILLDILGEVALLAAATGDGERAARLLGVESARREELGLPVDEWDRKEREQAIAQSRARSGSDAWQLAWEKGQAMSLQEAVDYALRNRS